MPICQNITPVKTTGKFFIKMDIGDFNCFNAFVVHLRTNDIQKIVR